MIRFVSRIIKLVWYTALLLAVLFAIALRFGPQWMAHEDVAGVADYIVPLGGNPVRAEYAADLFQRGYADRIFVGRQEISSEDTLLERYGIPVTRKELAYHYVLTAQGVPAGAVRFFGRALTNTVEEAEALAEAIGTGPGRIIVVTSPYHVFRTRMVLKRQLPEWTVMVVASPQDPPDQPDQPDEPWWRTQRSTRSVLMESVKIVYYLLGEVFRSGNGGGL